MRGEGTGETGCTHLTEGGCGGGLAPTGVAEMACGPRLPDLLIFSRETRNQDFR